MIQDVIDFLSVQEIDSLLSTFWFLFFIELPRFLLGACCFLFVLWRQRHATPQHPPTIPYFITVVISAHNNGEALLRTILSLRASQHVRLHLIVVNDASSDDTHARCMELKAASYIEDYIVLSSRGGKAAAVNLALNQTQSPYFMVTDADTTFDSDALWRACDYCQAPRVGGVSGNLEVRNWPANNITRIQAINYFFSIFLGRLVRDSLHFYFVASGAFSIFKTNIVKSLGAWEFGPGEDSDISTRLRVAGYQVRFAYLAHAKTHVPDTGPKLANQRLRWDRSLIRLRFRKYRDRVLNPFHANFRLPLAISFLDIYWFQILVPIFFYLYLINLFIQLGHFAFIVLFSVQCCYILADTVKLGFFLLVRSEPAYWALLWYTPLYSVANLYLLRMVKVFATFNELVWRGSYQDDYVPAKVRKRLIRY